MSRNNNSVNKVFQIVDALVQYPNGCSLAILAQDTGINKSTVYRFLFTLSELGYVVNTPEGNYRLTFKIANIGQKLIYETNIVQLAVSPLTELRNKTGETINLKFFHYNYGILLFKLEPKSGNFRTRTYMGQSIPLYCSASGKVFLSFRGDEFIDKYWKENKKSIVAINKNTVTKLEVFKKIAKQVRKNGYAVDHEENELGISCLAAPIFDIHNEINYAVSIALQSYKIENNLDKYLKPLLEITSIMSKELGYQNRIY